MCGGGAAAARTSSCSVVTAMVATESGSVTVGTGNAAAAGSSGSSCDKLSTSITASSTVKHAHTSACACDAPLDPRVHTVSNSAPPPCGWLMRARAESTHRDGRSTHDGISCSQPHRLAHCLWTSLWVCTQESPLVCGLQGGREP